MLVYVKNLYKLLVRDDVVMKGKSLIALAVVLSLTGCGGSGDDVSKDEQPWLGGQLPGGNDQDDGGDDVAENVAPEIVVDFSLLSEASFGQEVSLPVVVTDADGDEVTVSLYNAPNWLSWNKDEGVIKGVVDKIGDYPSFQVGAVDSNENEATLAVSQEFTVPMPESFDLNVKLPMKISAGDSVNMYFVDVSGQNYAPITFGTSVDYTGNAEFAGFSADFDTYKDRVLVVEWQSQNYAPWFNIVGSGELIETSLNNKLELSSDALELMAPTAQSAAYYHLLQKYGSRPGVTDIVGQSLASNYHGAFAGDNYTDMVAYYTMSQDYGELYGLNEVLSKDLFEGYELEVDEQLAGLPLIHEPGDDPALEREITRERLNYDSSVSGRLWEDLLDQESINAIQSGTGFNVGSGEWTLTYASSSLYGDSEGFVIKLNDGGTSEMVEGGNIIRGSWSSSSSAGESALVTSFDMPIDTQTQPIEDLSLLLTKLGMSATDANSYVEKAESSGLTTVDVSVRPYSEISYISHYVPFVGESIGEVSVSSDISLMGETVTLVKTQGANLVKSKKEKLSAWEFDKSIYEVVLKLPGEEGYQWLDLYYGDSVQFNKDVNNAPEKPWSWSYDEDEDVFTLTSNVDGEELVSRYIIEREPSMHSFNSGDINPRAYGVRNIVERNGVVITDELSSLLLHPTARCEFYTDDYPPCSVKTLQPGKVGRDSDGNSTTDGAEGIGFKLWVDTSLGAVNVGYTYNYQDFIYIGDVAEEPEEGEEEYNDYRIFSLESDPICAIEAKTDICFKSTSNQRLSNTYGFNRWSVDGKSWHPIYVNANEMIVLTEDGELKSYLAIDPVKLYGSVTVNLSW